MLEWLFGRKCALCAKKASSMRIYYNDQNKKIFVCPKCVIYAERRAFRKHR
jgi:hypothetical protein